MFVLIVPKHLSSFLNRRTERDIMINSQIHVKYSLFLEDFNET